MRHYILADYRRILTRVPRLVFVGIYELILVAIVLIGWKNGGPNYSSVNFMSSLNGWFFTCGGIFLGVCTLINSFADDFRSKTMQVAIGVGVSRKKVVAAKLIQAALILLTDILFTCLLIFLLTLITGAHLVPQQVGYLLASMLNVLLVGVCWISLISILVFKTQNMLMPMILYLILSCGLLGGILRLASQYGPTILQRLHLENYVPDYFLESLRTGLLMGRLDFGALVGVVFYICLGMVLTYLVFRKQELDF